MSLDLVASFLAGMCALALFTFHIVTSPDRRNWITLPDYIRNGLFVTGVVFMLRSVNLTAIASEISAPGKVNLEGFIALLCLTYTLVSSAVFILRRTYPPRVWDRLGYISKLASCGPKKEIRIAVSELASQGVQVVPPGGGMNEFLEAVEKAHPTGTETEKLRITR